MVENNSEDASQLFIVLNGMHSFGTYVRGTGIGKVHTFERQYYRSSF